MKRLKEDRLSEMKVKENRHVGRPDIVNAASEDRCE
jgi:hypothetical protein